MPKIYIEHDDHHNYARMITFDSEEAAIEEIARAEGVEHKEVWDELFDEDGGGEFNSSDKWTIITCEDADGRSRYWTEVAEAIRNDTKAPY